MTFYFYDLETSGINARAQRIMQFAGQRTDENFKPIGESHNWLIKLTDEVLPDPEAILLTGITPQQTLQEGYTEAEFIKLLYQEVLQPDTIILGFNSIRFDDEFMRCTLWRNFYDPYEWQWQDGRSRWDLLDVSRMVRALRPDGIEWPVDAKGQPTNRLELMTAANKLSHTNAHDALSDVLATIEFTKLIKTKQPKMFDYLLQMRSKKSLQQLINIDDPQPFLYCSGRYSNQWLKTTAVTAFAKTETGGALVYDLRQDPLQLTKLSDDELTEVAFSRNKDTESLPVKNLKLNACPAVAPLGVLDEPSQQRLQLSLKQIEDNFKAFYSIAGFSERLQKLYQQRSQARQKSYPKETDSDFQIYDGFIKDEDKTKSRVVRVADETSLSDLELTFDDDRLNNLLERYKARNFSSQLSSDERAAWEKYRTGRLMMGCYGQLSLQQFGQRLAELASVKADDEQAQFLLQELQLYAESIAPIPE